MSISELLFHTPWWLPTTIAGIGIVLFIMGNARVEAKVRNAGLGFIALAAVLITVSYLVDTDLEKAVKNTKRLVMAVNDRDWPTMQTLLDPKASLAVMGSGTPYNDRDKIIGGAKAGVDVYGLKNVHITSTDAQQVQTQITVTLDVLTEQDFTQGRPLPSSWQFDWVKTGNGWSMIRITCLKIANAQGNEARRQFPAPK
jgi:hypothetical protein